MRVLLEAVRVTIEAVRVLAVSISRHKGLYCAHQGRESASKALRLV